MCVSVVFCLSLASLLSVGTLVIAVQSSCSVIFFRVFKPTTVQVNACIELVSVLELLQCHHHFVRSYVTLVVMCLVAKFSFQLHGCQLRLRL